MDIVNVILTIILAVVYLGIISLALVNYILTSIGYYTLAKRRLIRNYGLAWVPVAREWIIGKIADEYDERNGHERNWSVALLVTSLLTVAVVIVIYVALMIVGFMGAYSGYGEEFAFKVFMIVYIPVIVLALAATAYEACRIICLFKIYESTNPPKALKYIILSVIIPLAHGICMLKVKNSGYDYEIYTETADCCADTEDAFEGDCTPCENEEPEITDSEAKEE